LCLAASSNPGERSHTREHAKAASGARRIGIAVEGSRFSVGNPRDLPGSSTLHLGTPDPAELVAVVREGSSHLIHGVSSIFVQERLGEGHGHHRLPHHRAGRHRGDV